MVVTDGLQINGYILPSPDNRAFRAPEKGFYSCNTLLEEVRIMYPLSDPSVLSDERINAGHRKGPAVVMITAPVKSVASTPTGASPSSGDK